MKFRFGAAAAALAIVSAVPAGAVTGSAINGLKTLQTLNVITFQNLNVTGGEVEGKAYVGGDVTGNTIQIGFGNNQQGEATSYRSTLAVGGNISNTVNLFNRSNGGNGLLGSYRANVAGNVTGRIALQDNSATVRVGGSLANIDLSQFSVVNVVQNITSNVDLRDNVTLNVGGSVGQVQGGNNTVVNVRGNVGSLGFGSNGTARIGGTLGGGNFSGANVTVVGSISNSGFGNNSIVKSGGSISGYSASNGTTIYAAGSISGNANGAVVNPNYSYNATVTAPVAPAAPVVASLSAATAQLQADMLALSSTLGGFAATNVAGNVPGNVNQVTFNVTDSNASTAAVFNLTTAQINSAQQFQFNFANLNKPVIFNIRGTDTINWNGTFASSSGLNAVNDLKSINQNVIWNFLDTTNLNIFREIHGSVLAPKATVFNQSNIEGSVVAKIFNISAEVHLGTYARNVTFLPPEYASATPEPAVWVQLITGFGLSGAVMRRRRKVVAA